MVSAENIKLKAGDEHFATLSPVLDRRGNLGDHPRNERENSILHGGLGRVTTSMGNT